MATIVYHQKSSMRIGEMLTLRIFAKAITKNLKEYMLTSRQAKILTEPDIEF